MDSASEKNDFRFVCAALVIGTFAAYAFILRAGFINYDDLDYVTDNQHVKGGLTIGNLLWAFTTAHASNWHPLTWISLMLDHQIYGLRAGGFHLTNLLLHVANCVLLFAVMKKITGALWRSAFVAALFAWHPLHVESVAWIAERKDVLSGLFWMLTMLFYLRYVEEAKSGGPKTKKMYGLALLFFICGLMSKPMVVTLPFVLLLLDFWPLARFADLAGLKRAALEKAPFFAFALASSVLTFAVQKAGKAVALLTRVPLVERIPNALVAYVTYLRKMIWPSDLAVFYPFEHHLPVWEWAGAAVLLAAITALAVASLKSRPYLAVGWFWYLGTLVPVIGLVQVGEQALADRYTYLPLVGIFIMVAWGVAEATQGWPQRTAVLKAGATCALGACLFLTMAQTGYWKDSMTLFTHDLAVAKDNRVAHANIGDVLDKQNKFSEARAEFMKALALDPNSAHTLTELASLCVHSGDVASATHYFDAALKQRPFYSDAHYEYGNLLASEGKYAEAANHYEMSLREKPESADAHNNLGAMYVQLSERDKAVEQFKIALELTPDYPEAHAQLGGVLADLGDADGARAQFAEAVRLKPNFAPYRIKFGLLLSQRRDSLDAAINQFLEAIKLDPNSQLAYSSLGAAYAHERRLNAAEESFARAVRIAPKDANLHGSLAAILAAERKPDEAVKEYRETLRLKPGLPAAERDLAWLLSTSAQATNRNGTEAVKLAEDANARMKSPDPRMLEALDVAYAEAGRFDDAIKTAEKVRQLALAARLDGVASQAEQRIALYKAGKPFHEAP